MADKFAIVKTPISWQCCFANVNCTAFAPNLEAEGTQMMTYSLLEHISMIVPLPGFSLPASDTF